VFTHQAAPLFCSHGPHIEIMTSIMTPSLHIYLKNNPAKFHPDLIRNDGALGFFEEVAPTGRRTTTTQQQQQDEL